MNEHAVNEHAVNKHSVNERPLVSIDTIRLVIPTLRGAFVLKGAAYLEDSRDRGRHAADAAVLLACMDTANDVWQDLSQQSRRWVRALVKALNEQSTPWTNHDAVVRDLARESLVELTALVGK
jgi:hypothetical protein